MGAVGLLWWLSRSRRESQYNRLTDSEIEAEYLLGATRIEGNQEETRLKEEMAAAQSQGDLEVFVH